MLQSRIAAEEALAAKVAEASTAAQMAAEAKGVRVAHEQEFKRVRVGAPSRRWPWVAAFVAAAAFIGFLWHEKPAPPQPPATASGEPLKLRLERELRK
jgi:hypothetical protein